MLPGDVVVLTMDYNATALGYLLRVRTQRNATYAEFLPDPVASPPFNSLYLGMENMPPLCNGLPQDGSMQMRSGAATWSDGTVFPGDARLRIATASQPALANPCAVKMATLNDGATFTFRTSLGP